MELDRAFWERRWQSTGDVRRAPNRTLTDVAASLPVGRALDAGCGEGVDAMWLAERGWTVLAVDFVASALERGRARATSTGFAERIEWQQADLGAWTPPVAAFDLVTAHYLHGVAKRQAMFRRLAAAVRPGGTLLIVGHHPSNVDISGGTMPDAVFFTTADVTAVLDDGWQLLTVDDHVPRRTVDHGGETVMLRSAVVLARRTASV